MCTKGKDCPYPHRQRTLAGVAENSESSDDSGDENKSKSRGKSRERTGKGRKNSSDSAAVCYALPRKTEDCTCRVGHIPSKGKRFEIVPPATWLKKGALIHSFNLRAKTLRKRVSFGKVQIFERKLQKWEMAWKYVSKPRDPNYRHRERLRRAISEYCHENAVYEAQELIKEIEEDRLEDEKKKPVKTRENLARNPRRSRLPSPFTAGVRGLSIPGVRSTFCPRTT